MKRRLLQHFLMSFIFLNPLLFAGASANSFTFLWTGNSTLNPANWSDPANWLNLDTEEVPTSLPADGDMLIDGAWTVYVTTSAITGSVQLSGGATLIINAGAILTTQEGGLDGSHGIRLDLMAGPIATGNYPGAAFSGQSASCTLVVRGTLNINVAAAANQRAPKAGWYINESNFGIVESTGKVNIIVAGTDGMEIAGILNNNGNITITDPEDSGIQINSGGEITIGASGNLTVSGGAECLNFRSNSMMTNNGTVQLSGASTGTIIKAGSPWNFFNNKNFRGSGLVERAKFFVHGPGSALMPGPSTGCLTFENGTSSVSLSGVTLYIQANGNTACTGYDQIIFSGSEDVGIAGAELQLTIGADYAPNGIITILEASAGVVSGTFNSVTVNNSSYTVDYNASAVSFSADGVTNTRSVALAGKNKWALYPALARDVVTVEWQEGFAGSFAIDVFNLSGQNVCHREAPAQTPVLEIPVRHLPPGMYWVAIRHNGVVETKRFVKE
ncbi:MAG: T9SS type A sorting domain-containing protein [Phaeodactylibacter sp.]|nr:T9SS type A sorting domain-containing protein [Phaeodactylibacter sp.]